ncbi:MAG: hypothetical protein LBG60_13760 [Bifidobacteriaceae bacterium]|nr:hypothetical protein [Bifidobacteriaceae bacterium]
MALRKVADPGRLARIALEAKTWDIRARCCARLEDAAVLERASQQDPDQLVRKAAAAKLRIIKERPPTSPAPSFQSLFFQVGLFSRGEIAKDANEFDYDSMKVCDRFISYGEGAAQAMKSYLMACAAGQEQFGWWRNSRLLVPRIPLAAGDSPAAQPMLEAWLTQLVKAPSRIAEYDK